MPGATVDDRPSADVTALAPVALQSHPLEYAPAKIVTDYHITLAVIKALESLAILDPFMRFVYLEYIGHLIHVQNNIVGEFLVFIFRFSTLI